MGWVKSFNSELTSFSSLFIYRSLVIKHFSFHLYFNLSLLCSDVPSIPSIWLWSPSVWSSTLIRSKANAEWSKRCWSQMYFYIDHSMSALTQPDVRFDTTRCPLWRNPVSALTQPGVRFDTTRCPLWHNSVSALTQLDVHFVTSWCLRLWLHRSHRWLNQSDWLSYSTYSA